MTKVLNGLALRIEKKYGIEVQAVNDGRYFKVIGNIGDKKVILKIRKPNSTVKKHNFIREILTDKILNGINLKDRKFFYRGIYEYSLEYPQWIIFKYCDGKTAGGHWFFSDDFYHEVPPERMHGLLNFWPKDFTDLAEEKKNSLPYKFDKADFYQICKRFDLQSDNYLNRALKDGGVEKIYNEEEKSEIKGIFKKNEKIIKKNIKYICHRDFNPKNILTDKGEIILFDFEKVCYDIPTMDLSFVYLTSWNNLAWRNRLIHLFLEREEDKILFKTLFYIALLRLFPHIIFLVSPQENENFNTALSVFKNDYEEAVNYFKDKN